MNLSDIKGVGPTRLSKLRAMGISSLRDLLFCLPYRYEDHRTLFPCSTRQEGNIMVMGIVKEKPSISYFHGKSTAFAQISDDYGKMSLRWYNQPWIVSNLPVGVPVMIYGRLSKINNGFALINGEVVTKQGLVSVYKLPKGLPQKSFRNLISTALPEMENLCEETLPSSFMERYHLCDLYFALKNVHFPSDEEALRKARRRFAFENILLYLSCAEIQGSQKQAAHPFAINNQMLNEYWKLPPFPPTEAQKRVLNEIAEDLKKPESMSRLVQGDVGCGKTAVAFGALFLAYRCGFQGAMMAPTEILAHQHYETAKQILEPCGIHCCLLTGNTKAKERKEILASLSMGTCNCIFGTHALISEGVNFSRLGIVITDEQHRFGVRQRSRLQEKGALSFLMPHVLVMSATPIPRTLALILYGDLDLSTIDELPPGRLPVKTRLVPENKRPDLYRFIHQKIKNGEQVYIVCPLVDDSENSDQLRSAKTVYKELVTHVFSDLRIGLTWGNQKSDEKNEILRKFASGEIDILVSTTVIEVGVNVPNASVMVIENASHYGLSQLHQLRGRVGRGKAESWCFLLSSDTEKLHILVQTNDGFLVAQKDLELRGPGELMGTKQSGENQFHIFMDSDAHLLQEVSDCVHEVFRTSLYEEEKSIITGLAQEYASNHLLSIARN